MKIDHLSTALPGYVNARWVRNGDRLPIPGPARAEWQGAGQWQPSPGLPLRAPALPLPLHPARAARQPAPPRPGRALTPGLGRQTRHRAGRCRLALRLSPGCGGGRGSLGRPGAPPALLSPFQRPGGSGREKARWRTGSLASPRATGLGGGVEGARTSAPQAGGERALSPSRGAAVPSVFHRAATCTRMPRAARAGTGYSAELRERRSRLSASVLPRSGTAPAGRGPATYLLLGVSRGSTKGVCKS